LNLDPAFEKAHYNLGISLLDEGKDAEAKSRFQKAVDINPNFAEARAEIELNAGFKADGLKLQDYIWTPLAARPSKMSWPERFSVI